jgi:hypothetical protein
VCRTLKQMCHTDMCSRGLGMVVCLCTSRKTSATSTTGNSSSCAGWQTLPATTGCASSSSWRSMGQTTAALTATSPRSTTLPTSSKTASGPRVGPRPPQVLLRQRAATRGAVSRPGSGQMTSSCGLAASETCARNRPELGLWDWDEPARVGRGDVRGKRKLALEYFVRMACHAATGVQGIGEPARY